GQNKIMPGSGLKKEKLNLTRPAARPPCRRESPDAENEKAPGDHPRKPISCFGAKERMLES
ncbi:MAG: hypothetical protein RBR18_14870, partial [Desulfovibrionaceae bacterium]|nr:hypothetical protein [Desulfovibrionaceae bacterium]